MAKMSKKSKEKKNSVDAGKSGKLRAVGAAGAGAGAAGKSGKLSGGDPSASGKFKSSDPSASQNLLPYGSRSDVGYVREHNEDSLLVAAPLFVVCDGMGGHEAGEVASEIAIQTISHRAPAELDAEGLGHAVEEANLAVIQAARKGIGREGMGTTCTAAMLEGERLAIAQVGDSRAYLMHDNVLQQLTRDHSVVADLIESGEITPQEARTHQWRSYITRALGLDPFMEADIYEIKVSAGDRLMLCTDGLYSMIGDDVIADTLRNVPNPQEATDELVELALEAGGTDNITCIVVNISGYSAQKSKKIARNAKITAALIIALMISIIAVMGFGFNYWLSTSAYLGVQDDKIAVYKGVPGDFLGMQFSTLEKVTDISVDDIQPGTATRIENGDIRCDSVAAADDLIAQYEADIKKRNPHSGSSDAGSAGDPGSGASASASASASSTQSSSQAESQDD